MTKAETDIAERVRAMHSGEQALLVTHSLPANRITTPLVLGQSLKQFEVPSANGVLRGAARETCPPGEHSS